MRISFIFSEDVVSAETREELDRSKKSPEEGCLLSEAELSEYCDVAEDILGKAEGYFPEFAGDTGTQINLYFVDNEMIREINMEERNVDRATDVLSFPFLELKEGDGSFDVYDLDRETGAIMLGEIIVSVEKLKEQALEYGHSERRELAFLLCHGFLHLMGYDHIIKEDEEKMFSLTEKILDENGYERK